MGKLFVLFIFFCTVFAEKPSDGTPKDIRNLWIKRCNEFQKSSVVQNAYGNWKYVHCSTIVDGIIRGFEFKDQCGAEFGDYDDPIRYSMQPLIADKVCLWSGLEKCANAIGLQMDLYTVGAGTLLGFLADGINFCGQTSEPGINQDDCPCWGCCKSGYDAKQIFWRSMSIAFAQGARGVVSILLRGSGTGDAFRESSVLAREEIPYLNANMVTGVNVILLHIPYEPIREYCNGSSILKMKIRILDKGIPFNCVDDPLRIKNYLREHPTICGAATYVVNLGTIMVFLMLAKLTKE